MTPIRLLPRLFAGLLALSAGSAAAAAVDASTVQVRYEHPQQFTESREARAFAPGRLDDDYLGTLRRYMEKRARRVLADGQRLDIVVTDIDRAGSYEPWHGPWLSDVRFVRDVYPPRIELRFRLTDANGAILREGQRTLRDLAFMHGTAGAAFDQDPLRYEKALIDRWLRRGAEKL